MKIKNIIFILIFYFLSLNNLYSIEPEIFVQSTVNRASNILSLNKTKEEKISKLKTIANETVDINGIGFYTLGSTRKNLSENQKKNMLIYLSNIF